METSAAAEGESVSQDLRFCVVLCSVPRVGAEGTEERVLARHTEKSAKEIDESASDVVDLRHGTMMFSPRTWWRATLSCLSWRVDFASWLQEEVCRAFWRRRHRGACLGASIAHRGVVQLAKETDESASDVVVYGMAR